METVVVNDRNIRNPPPEALTTTRLRFNFKSGNVTQDALQKMISAHSNLRYLKFKIDICEPHIETFMTKMIEANPDLESVITDYLIVDMVPALQKLVNLRTLRIIGSLSRRIVHSLDPLLSSLTNLGSFELRNLDQLENRLLLYRKVIGPHPSLRKLTVNAHSSSELEDIRTSLPYFKNLSHLTINSAIEDTSLSIDMSKIIQRNHPHITFVYNGALRVRPYLISGDLTYVSELVFLSGPVSTSIIEHNFPAPLPNLYKMNIYELNDKTAPAVIQILNRNPYVTHVVIFNMSSGSYLPVFMTQLANVIHLEIRWTSIDSTKYIISGLRGHQHLEHLSLCCETFSPEAPCIFEMVKTIPTLLHYKGWRYSGDLWKIKMAKDLCRKRKYNHKTLNRTLVSRLLGVLT